MNEKERYIAKIEARMTSFNDTIEKIITKSKVRKEMQPDIAVDDLVRKHEDAKAKLKEMKKSGENAWQQFKTELDEMFDDVDEDLRKATAYFG
jgi:hypothetical protein